MSRCLAHKFHPYQSWAQNRPNRNSSFPTYGPRLVSLVIRYGCKSFWSIFNFRTFLLWNSWISNNPTPPHPTSFCHIKRLYPAYPILPYPTTLPYLTICYLIFPHLPTYLHWTWTMFQFRNFEEHKFWKGGIAIRRLFSLVAHDYKDQISELSWLLCNLHGPIEK